MRTAFDSRRPFTPRVTPAADRVDASGAPLEFRAELEPRPAFSEPTVRLEPAPAPAPRGASPLPRASRRLIWLTAILAACAPLVWIAVRDVDPAVTSQTALVTSPPVAPPTAPIVLAAVHAAAPEIPAAPSPAAKPDRPRSRDDSRAPVGHPSKAASIVPAAAAPAEASAAFYGVLVVDSDPAGARVFVNGKAVGSTPLVVQDMPVGSRVVRIEADGYQPWSSAVRIVADEQTRVAATLQR